MFDLFKTDEQRAAEAARKAEANYRASPVGMAEDAFKRGDEFFQVEISRQGFIEWGRFYSYGATSGPTDVLGRIEAAGWTLEHANWVYVQTGSTIRNSAMTGPLVVAQHSSMAGEIYGVYLFRRKR